MYTTTTNNSILFCDYYKQWITVYKEGAIRPVTMNKYNMAHQWLEKLIPNLTLAELDRFAYQNLSFKLLLYIPILSIAYFVPKSLL